MANMAQYTGQTVESALKNYNAESLKNPEFMFNVAMDI